MRNKFFKKIIARSSDDLQFISAYCSNSSVKINDIKYLKKNKIHAVISYTPLHKSKAGKKYKTKKDNLYFTNNLINKIVRLPLHYYLTFKEVDYICLKIRKYFKR